MTAADWPRERREALLARTADPKCFICCGEGLQADGETQCPCVFEHATYEEIHACACAGWAEADRQTARADAAEADLAEARRRRDAWKERAADYEVMRKALREKVGDPGQMTLSRALWAGIYADQKRRAMDAEAERDALAHDLARLKAGDARLHAVERAAAAAASSSPCTRMWPPAAGTASPITPRTAPPRWASRRLTRSPSRGRCIRTREG